MAPQNSPPLQTPKIRNIPPCTQHQPDGPKAIPNGQVLPNSGRGALRREPRPSFAAWSFGASCPLPSPSCSPPPPRFPFPQCRRCALVHLGRLEACACTCPEAVRCIDRLDTRQPQMGVDSCREETHKCLGHVAGQRGHRLPIGTLVCATGGAPHACSIQLMSLWRNRLRSPKGACVDHVFPEVDWVRYLRQCCERVGCVYQGLGDALCCSRDPHA